MNESLTPAEMAAAPSGAFSHPGWFPIVVFTVLLAAIDIVVARFVKKDV